LILCLLTAAPAGPTDVAVANDQLRIRLDGSTGQLMDLIALDGNHNLLGDGSDRPGLWELRLRQGETVVSLFPTQSKRFRAEPLPGEPAGVRLVWQDFAQADAPDLQVEATVRMESGQPMSQWTIAVSGLGKLGLQQVSFPRVCGLARQENERLAVPDHMGQLLPEPRKLVRSRRGWDYPGPLSMQFLAYYQDQGPGFYAAADDTAAFRKTFAVWPDAAGRMHFEVVHYPGSEAQPAGSYAPTYRVRLGTFRGDWLTAAERYRPWALQQPWANESRLEHGLSPDWVRQTGIWAWNRGRSPDVLSPALKLQEVSGLPTSVFWHWWHGCAYDTGFPEYLPPREGADAFKQALSTAQSQGIHALVYMNQRLWGMTTKSWIDEQAERFAVKGPDGKIRPEVYNIFTHQACASMCLATPFWQAKYAGLAEQAFRQLSVDGVYMDQACLNLMCYDAQHGHTLGGGNYWMQGFRTLASDIRKRCEGPRNIVLAGEGCGETWIPYLDLMLTLEVSRERYAGLSGGAEVIPLFQAVYHPLALTYGNYSSLVMPPYDELWPAESAPREPMALLEPQFGRQFRLEQARSFVWGLQPTIANFLPSLLDSRPAETAYAIRLAQTRHKALKYLVHGTFLRPPAIEVPAVELDLLRMSIYTGRATFRKAYPSALASAWRAPDGDVAVVLANLVDEELTLHLNLDATVYGLRSPAQIYRIDETSRSPLGRYEGGNPSLELRLPAGGASIVEFSNN
jgi:hypothetical protein